MTERPMFFGPFTSERPTAMMRGIRDSSPELGLRVLTAIHAHEDAAVQRQLSDEFGRQLRSRLGPWGETGGQSVDALVDSYIAYASFSRLTRTLAFLFGDKEPPFLQVHGLDVIRERRSDERILLVPFHVRHYEALLGTLVGLAQPLSVLVAPQFAHWMQQHDRAADVDLQFVAATSPAVLYLCRRALAAGRTMVWYPDHYTGRGKPDVRVNFLGTELAMSSTLPLFCQREGVTSAPCFLRATKRASTGEPALEMTFGPRIAPPGVGGAQAYLQGLCDYYEASLREDDSCIEWLGWEKVASDFDATEGP